MKSTLGHIFISYRHADTQDIAGRIRDWLIGARHIPPENVFMDDYSIDDGAAFPQAVGQAIEQCHTMIVVIGHGWFVGDKTPARYVHDEVKLAFDFGLNVLVALVHDASMPDPDKLPQDIRQLAYRRARKVHSDETFRDDMAHMFPRPSAVPSLWALGLTISLALVLVVAIALSQFPLGNPVYRLFHSVETPSATMETNCTSGLYCETSGSIAHTWSNYVNAGGVEGPTVPSNQTIQVACKISGFKVADGNSWWYRIASSPWSNEYYVSADNFYNDGATFGSLQDHTIWVDPKVPTC